MTEAVWLFAGGAVTSLASAGVGYVGHMMASGGPSSFGAGTAEVDDA